MARSRAHTRSIHILAVGGMRRKIGKTTLTEAILRGFPGVSWNALKISPHRHERGPGTTVLASQARPAFFRLSEQREANSANDTGRFKAAGAIRSLFLEASGNAIEDGLNILSDVVKEGFLICETTRAIPYLKPDLFLMIVEKLVPPAKPSSPKALALANAFVIGGEGPVRRNSSLSKGFGGKPLFRMGEKDAEIGASLKAYIESLFFGSRSDKG